MRLDCRQWDALLDDWRDGRLDAATADACRIHADGCHRCREILDLLDGDLPVFTDAPDLTADILSATSGSACDRARDLIGASPDGETAPADAALLAAHLEHCTDCAEVAEIVAWAVPAVAELAEPEPAEAFTYDVLRATSQARRSRRSGSIGRMGQRIGAWWDEQVRRPNFAWEIAFVATVLAVAVFGTPVSPGREAPRRALEVVRAGPDWVIARGGEAVAAFADLMVDLKEGMDDRRDRTAPDRADLQRHGLELGGALLDADRDAAAEELGRIRNDIDRIWEEWRNGDPSSALPDTSQATNEPR